ncbi:MAG TPA: hypothetical protein VF814_21735 [Casimicrobiaceae bacterium]
MSGQRRIAIGLAMGTLAACAAAPPQAPTPVAPATAPVAEKREPLPVTPVPVPQVVIVQTPAPAPPQVTAQPPPQPPAPAPLNDEEQQALALLADLQRYAIDPSADLKRELAAANATFSRTRSDASRIRMAMLLTLPAAGPPDDTRALALLEPIVDRSGNSSVLRQVAALLYAQIGERARSVREQQKRTAAAQEKLDALRAVERSLLLERSRNAGGGSAGGGGGTGR